MLFLFPKITSLAFLEKDTSWNPKHKVSKMTFEKVKRQNYFEFYN